MLPVDAVLLAEPSIEGVGKGAQVRRRSAAGELDEERVPRLRRAIDADVRRGAEVERRAPARRRGARDGALDLHVRRELLRHGQTPSEPTHELDAKGRDGRK